MGIIVPKKLGIFAYFRVFRFKISCREVHQKKCYMSTEMMTRVAKGGAAGCGKLQEGFVIGRH